MSEGRKPCDEPGCGRPASIHLTQVVDNETSTYCLCLECAREKGVGGAEPTPSDIVADVLAHITGAKGAKAESGGASDEACGFCGLDFDGFASAGQLGCPQCYETFERGLRRLLGRIHGESRHVGKVYLPPEPRAEEVVQRLDGLKRSLRRAIADEDFERAAVLRDMIRDHEAVR